MKIDDSISEINLSNYQLSNFILRVYREKLRRNPTEIELKHFLTQINDGTLKIDDFVNLLGNCKERMTLINSNWDLLPEPRLIFISCFNNENGTGGIFFIHDNSLISLIEGMGCFGLCYVKEHNLLFCVTRETPQILAFQITPDYKILRVPVEFENYVFANDSHGILVRDDKIFVVSTQGEEPPQLAEPTTEYGKFVGKIIISDFEINNSCIKIKNSTVLNPFNCKHHHHINDLCEVDSLIYLSSFSSCKSSNSLENGTISKLNFAGNSSTIITGLDKPHSLKYFKNKLYITSSGTSKIFSYDSSGMKLEYKGPDAFVRGLNVIFL